jgi:hypothetical protein
VAKPFGAWGKRAALALSRALLCLAVLIVVGAPLAARANDSAKLFATTEKGFGRIILDFSARLDLPPYKISSDNGVLAIVFDSPVSFTVPDIASALPDYVTIARVDPDNRGIRLGLRSTLTVNHIVAGEQLFIDLMPSSWQGLPPSLPPEVIANLADKAKQAALHADQARKAEEAKLTSPAPELRVGRNPTFVRMEFFWNVDTEGKFAFDGKNGNLDFDWPVPIDLSVFKANLPKQLLSVDNSVTPDGSRVVFHAADKMVPRFYQVSSRDFIVDIDTPSLVPADPTPEATTLAASLTLAMGETSGKPAWWQPLLQAAAGSAAAAEQAPRQAPITPQIASMGSTIRITFPFDRDTPAAVFRRGDVVWMMFDTNTGINPPPPSADLASFASNFTIVPTGDMQVVRLDLASDRLATLGSEGRAWVLSLGDGLLTATEPMTLMRGTDSNGLRQVTTEVGKPGTVHQFLDPVVGDRLDVVTAYPPARGITRDLDMVDFEAIKTIQGLVIRPEHDDVTVRLNGTQAIIAAASGLTLSSPDVLAQAASAAAAVASRSGFMDLASMREDNPVKFRRKADELAQNAASADGHALDQARLDLAHYYIANRYAIEAIGVLGVMQATLNWRWPPQMSWPDGPRTRCRSLTRLPSPMRSMRGCGARWPRPIPATTPMPSATLWRPSRSLAPIQHGYGRDSC